MVRAECLLPDLDNPKMKSVSLVKFALRSQQRDCVGVRRQQLKRFIDKRGPFEKFYIKILHQ